MTTTAPATPPAPAVGRLAPDQRAIVAAAGAAKALAWAAPLKDWLRREESRP